MTVETKRVLWLGLVGLMLVAGSAQAAVIAQFDMDSINGRTVADGANGHDATFNRDTALVADDPFGLPGSSSARLIGTSAPVYHIAYAADPLAFDLNNGGTNEYTLEAWFKPNAIYGSDIVKVAQVNSGSVRIDVRPDGTLRAAFYQGNEWKVASVEDALEVGTWYHLASVYNRDSDAFLRLYVDAVEVANVYVGQAIGAPLDSGGAVNIGATANGWIDDVRISNHAMEVSDLGFYGSFTPEPTTALLLVLGGLVPILRRRK